MKKINLTLISENPSGYFVNLGNGTIHKFKNKKKAEKFLVKTSHFLTAQLITLNELYITVFTDYRRTWLLMDSSPKDSKVMNPHIHCREIKDIISRVDHAFERLQFQRYSPSFNSLAFSFLFKAANALKEAVTELKEFDKSKSYTVNKYRYNSLINQIQFVESEIRNFETTKAFKLDVNFKVDVSESDILSRVI